MTLELLKMSIKMNLNNFGCLKSNGMRNGSLNNLSMMVYHRLWPRKNAIT